MQDVSILRLKILCELEILFLSDCSSLDTPIPQPVILSALSPEYRVNKESTKVDSSEVLSLWGCRTLASGCCGLLGSVPSGRQTLLFTKQGIKGGRSPAESMEGGPLLFNVGVP